MPSSATLPMVFRFLKTTRATHIYPQLPKHPDHNHVLTAPTYAFANKGRKVTDMSTIVPMLVISGSMGSGKTTVLSEASDLLVKAGMAHAAIDLDCLSIMYPPQGQHGERIMFKNLAAIWPVYAAAGAERLLIAGVVEHQSELQRYREAVPGAEPVVCRLKASIDTMQERLRTREPGMFQAQAIARSAMLADILERSRAEDFTGNNDEGRLITDVAREVLSRAGWL